MLNTQTRPIDTGIPQRGAMLTNANTKPASKKREGENPTSGTSLSDALAGWRVRHGGTRRWITIVFRLAVPGDRLQIALVAFSGQN